MLQTLAIRPLCELILNNAGDDDALAEERASLCAVLQGFQNGADDLNVQEPLGLPLTKAITDQNAGRSDGLSTQTF